MVYGVIMAGWASNSKYPFLAALRSAAQMVSYEVSIGFVIITVLLCVGSLQPHRHRRSAEHALGPARLVLAAAVPDVHRVLRLGAGRDQPAAVRSGRGRVRAGRRLHGRIRLDPVHDVHARRVRRDRHHVRDDHDPVPRRLAAADPDRAVHLGAGRDLVRAQGVVRVLHVRDGEGVRAALPLRPADAARLEGVPAALARDGGDRRGGVAVRRLAPNNEGSRGGSGAATIGATERRATAAGRSAIEDVRTSGSDGAALWR